MAAKRKIIGLDVGRHAVKLAWAERRGGTPHVTRTETLRLPPGTADVKSVVLPWLEQQKVAGSHCVIGIPGFQSMFQPFVLAPGDPRSLEDAAAMETVKFNEMASETMVYGFTPIALNEGEKRLLLAMARPTLLDHLLAWGRDAGVQLVDIVPTPVALSKSLGGIADTETSPTLILSIGHSSTDLAVVSPAAGLMFARAFASGGQVFTDRLARAQNMPAGQAENLKVTNGSLLPDTELAPTLKQAADAWLGEVEACLSVYRSLYTGRTGEIRKVLVTGGASKLPGLVPSVSARLDVPAEAVSEVHAGHAGMQDAGAFAVAAGLAFCGLESHEDHISLLPQDVRDELTFKRQKPFWIAAGLMAVLIFGASLVGGFRDFRKQAAQLQRYKADLKKRQELVQQIETLRHRNEQVHAAGRPLRTLIGAGPVMRRLIGVVAEQKAGRDRITMISDADSYFFEADWDEEKAEKLGMRERRRKAKRGEERVASKGIERVIVEGYTRDLGLARVKEMIHVLRSKPYVTRADLLSDDKLVGGTQEWSSLGRLFVIDVSIDTRWDMAGDTAADDTTDDKNEA